jgi:hypothetical protein
MHTPDAFEQRNAFLELLLHARGVREREQARRAQASEARLVEGVKVKKEGKRGKRRASETR